jgi:hypothetical protein
LRIRCIDLTIQKQIVQSTVQTNSTTKTCGIDGISAAFGKDQWTLLIAVRLAAFATILGR